MSSIRPDDLLDTDELAALLGVRPSSLRSMRAQPERHRRIDGLPAPLRTISGRPVWRRSDVEAWMAGVNLPTDEGPASGPHGLPPERT